MNEKYRYRDVHLKPKIAEELIQILFSGKTVSRCEIDKAIIRHHESQGASINCQGESYKNCTEIPTIKWACRKPF